MKDKTFTTRTDNFSMVSIRYCFNDDPLPQDEVVINHQSFGPQDYFEVAALFLKRGLKLAEAQVPF